MASALRDYFWSGDFTYDVTVDPADDTSAIEAFLQDRRGFCVQFASVYAVMARSLGIPARVAVGFTPGDDDNGVYTVRSHDAHAWPELWLDGLGWTHLFDPTPAVRSTAQPGGSRLPGDREGSTTQPTPTTTVAPPPATTPGGAGTGATTPSTTLAPLPTRVSTREQGGNSDWWLLAIGALVVVVVLPVLYVLLVTVAKARRRTRRRGAADPAVAVRGAWEEALDRLHEARVPSNPALTPFELARERCRSTESPRPLVRSARWRASTRSCGTGRAGRHLTSSSARGTPSTSSTAPSTRVRTAASVGAVVSIRRRCGAAGNRRPRARAVAPR